MFSKQFKWLYIAGFVVVIGLVIGGGVWWRSWEEEHDVVSGDEVEVVNEIDTADREEIDISDWKVYQDNNYGIIIKYPPDWKLVDLGILTLLPGDKIPGTPEKPQIMEKIELLIGSSQSLESISEIGLGMNSDIEIVDIIVDGYPAKRAKFHWLSGDVGMRLAIKQGDVTHHFISYINQERGDNFSIFNAILENIRIKK